MVEIPIILLAAGSSARMGQPKQLLPWGGTTLIEYQVNKLLSTGNHLTVVLGANADQISRFISRQEVTTIVNDKWESGIGSSVSAGVEYIDHRFPGCVGVLVVLADQPLVPVEHFRSMLDRFRPGGRQIIISSDKGGCKGVPAIFDRFYFPAMMSLSGESGAKQIIKANIQYVTELISDGFLEDIDTYDSYRRLIGRCSEHE